MRRIAIAFGCALSGCNEHALVHAPELVSQTEATTSFCRGADPKLDVLFVIDDSASMATEAVKLANALREIAEILEWPGPCPFELRVAVTTTSTCGAEVGSFVSTSCRERLADFVVDASIEGPSADVRDEACTDVCPLESLTLAPSLVAGSTTARPRPWVQFGRYGNLPDGVGLADALACTVPVGLTGCTHETPLLALQAALARTQDPGDPQHGFLRADASLFVVIVADEDEPATDVSSYVEMMRGIQAAKVAAGSEVEVVVSLVGGVAFGYENGVIESVDGCNTLDEVTPPTSHLVQFVAALSDVGSRNVFSSCYEDYTVAMLPIAAVILDPPIVPRCLPFCLADADPSTPELDPSCHAARSEIVGDAGVVEMLEEPLPPCLPDGAGSRIPPPGAVRCLDIVGDEELDGYCVERGWNAEARLLSVAPSSPSGDVCIEVTCAVSLTPELDCSGL